jgi:hypothetical protein
MTALTITEGLDAADYPAVAAKVAAHGVRDRWCAARAEGRECACLGCANQHLTWAEYECWKKYDPAFNRIGHDDCGSAPDAPV